MRLPSICLLVAMLGCRGSETTTPPAETPATTEAPAATETPAAWADMNKEQRGKYMAEVVTPKMKDMFVAFDPRFAEFGCETCHGASAKDGTFTMPNPEILVLPSDPAAFEKLDPKWMEFMATKVKPEMAALLGRESFDPANPNPDAFGCHGCHTVEGH